MIPAKCPICERPVVAEFSPFCSTRCADVDLHRWLTGRYVAPGAEPAEDAGEDEADD